MGIIKYLASKAKYHLGKNLRKEKFVYNSEIQAIVMDIKKNGFSLIPNFFSEKECIVLKKEVDNVIALRKDQKCLWVDSYGSDERCFAAEDDSDLIAEIHGSQYFQDVADNVFQAKMACSNTLASRIEYKEGNLGSGQGWHRDGNHFQFKAIVFLTDVEINDGPFSLLVGSHKPKSILNNIKINKYDGVKLRFEKSEVDRLISMGENIKETFTAKAGSVVFFDASCVHAGSPLRDGGLRYALTNYYYPSYENIAARKAEFVNAYKKQR